MNIFLIGYRGTGKTTVGRDLAERLGWGFVDADERAVAAAGRSIAELVAEEGWPAFRVLERTVLCFLARGKRQVIATGGGVVLDRRNVTLMRAAGMVIWLRATPETIFRRISADAATAAQRPSLTAMADLKAEIAHTLAERRPLYAAAMDAAVDTDGRTVSALTAAVADMLAPHCIAE